LMKWLPEKGATLISVSRYGEVTDKGLSILTRDGKWQILEADTITTALPLKPNTGLKKDLEGKVPELYAIGDCNDPRLILHAVSDGYRVASNI
jgi:thioredoxin reductase